VCVCRASCAPCVGALPEFGSGWLRQRFPFFFFFLLGNASLDLEGVGSDGVDGPPQALDGSVVAGGVGAMDTLADIATAVVDMAARVLAAAGAAPAAAAGLLGLRRSELRRWGHRAQSLSRREREIPSSASGGPCPACRVVFSPCRCSSLSGVLPKPVFYHMVSRMVIRIQYSVFSNVCPR
jgi:hypothetical protein